MQVSQNFLLSFPLESLMSGIKNSSNLSFSRSRNAFLGMIPGSVNPVSIRNRKDSTTQMVVHMGRAGVIRFHSGAARNMQQGIIIKSRQMQYQELAIQSLAGPVMQRPEQQKRFRPGQSQYTFLVINHYPNIIEWETEYEQWNRQSDVYVLVP